MDLSTALDVASSGLKANRSYLNVISMNLANSKTTRTMNGGPYQRKSVVFETTDVLNPFDKAMWDAQNRELKGVTVRGIVTDSRPVRLVYEPGHPDANKEGYVAYPDINVVEEMTNMMVVQRSYEANVQSVEAVKRMFMRAIRIGQG